MDQTKKYCPNCYNQVENGSEECPRCYTKISHNLENFLLAKYKIFTLIGVFGALSIYLLTTSQKNSDSSLLLLGSLYCLTIVIILSGICIWDLFIYSFRDQKIDYKNLSIRDIFYNVKPLPALILFTAFFCVLIFILSIYILSNTAVNETIIYSFFLTAVAIIAISVIYYPYRYFVEKFNNWIRAVIFVFLLFALFSFIKTQITTGPNNPISISLTAIFSSILIVLLIKCLALMYRDMISVKNVPSIDTTPVEPERKSEGLPIEDRTEPQKKELTGNPNEKNRDERRKLFGIALIVLGIILNFIIILIFGNNSPLYTPFGFGVYFLGLTLVVNSWFSQKEEFISLNSKIEELSKKIDDTKK